MVNTMVNRIVNEVDEALKMFGTYTFSDKGPREVMDLDGIVDDMKQMHPEDAADVLCELLDMAQDDVNGDYLEHFVEAALVDLQDVDDGWWDILISRPELAERF